jgi:hypothetical protein
LELLIRALELQVGLEPFQLQVELQLTFFQFLICVKSEVHLVVKTPVSRGS